MNLALIFCSKIMFCSEITANPPEKEITIEIFQIAKHRLTCEELFLQALLIESIDIFHPPALLLNEKEI